MKKSKKRIKQLMGAGVMMGAGQVAVSSVGGGNVFSGMSGMMPGVGSVVGAGMLVESTKLLKPKKKRRK
ncbi:hypothetical protein KKE60_04920 [Patescibacteria group bacterium]|nr:hypothetical protein [Patescibacteria group bacterium]